MVSKMVARFVQRDFGCVAPKMVDSKALCKNRWSLGAGYVVGRTRGTLPREPQTPHGSNTGQRMWRSAIVLREMGEAEAC